MSTQQRRTSKPCGSGSFCALRAGSCVRPREVFHLTETWTEEIWSSVWILVPYVCHEMNIPALAGGYQALLQLGGQATEHGAAALKKRTENARTCAARCVFLRLSARWCALNRALAAEDTGWRLREKISSYGEDAAEGRVASVAADPHCGVAVSQRISEQLAEDFSHWGKLSATLQAAHIIKESQSAEEWCFMRTYSVAYTWTVYWDVLLTSCVILG